MADCSTFCILPFVAMNVHLDGGLAPCCYQSHDDVTHYFQDWQQWRGPGLEELKQDLCSGRRNKLCQRCWDLEDNGVKSYRQHSNDKFPNHPAWNIDISDSDWKNIQYDVEFLHLDFDSYCNLRCIMCHPTVSTSIESEYVKNKEKYTPFVGNVKITKEKWYDTDAYQYLEQQLPNVKLLILTGGEPLINPKVVDLIEQIPDLSNLDLVVTTNASLIRENVWELLSKIKSVGVTVSLEGVDQHNDYLRYGSEWNVVEGNLLRFNTMPNLKYGAVTVNHVLQFTSQWSLIPLIEFCTQHKLNLNISRLDYPPYLSIDGMLKDEKDSLIDSLTNVLNRAERIGGNGAWIKSAIKDLEKSPVDHEKRKKFFEYVSMLDQIRGTDFGQVFGDNR